MAEIKIRGKNNDLYFQMIGNDYYALNTLLEEKMIELSKHSVDCWIAFFHFDFKLSEQQLMGLIYLVHYYHGIIKSIVYDSSAYASYELVQEAIKAGNRYDFHQDCVLVNRISQYCEIHIYNRLVCMDTLRGNILCHNVHCEIYANALENANITFLGKILHNVTVFAPVSIYYENGNIIVKETLKHGSNYCCN